jgi:predicted phosphoribosyltransferase
MKKTKLGKITERNIFCVDINEEGVPRSGVVVAEIVAKKLSCQFDIIIQENSF